MKASITFRVNYRDLIAIKKIVKPEQNESLAHWFWRVRLWMERKIKHPMMLEVDTDDPKEIKKIKSMWERD